MAAATVAPRSASAEVAALLESPEIGALVRHLEETRWTGRPGFPIRVTADHASGDWIIERCYGPGEGEWREAARIPGQLEEDFA